GRAARHRRRPGGARAACVTRSTPRAAILTSREAAMASCASTGSDPQVVSGGRGRRRDTAHRGERDPQGSAGSAMAGVEGWPWPRRLVQGQRLPPGEALVGAVPEGDLLLAELPAKQDLPAVVDGGEVDEATLGVLDERAERVDLVDGADQLLRGPLHLGA